MCIRDSYETIQGILGEKAVVSDLESRRTLESRDLDCFTDKEEVEEAFKRDLPDLGKFKVGLTPENPRGQRIAILDLGDKSSWKIS